MYLKIYRHNSKYRAPPLMFIISGEYVHSMCSGQFLSFRTVVTCVTFSLLAVIGFLLSRKMPKADLITGETIIVVKSDNLLFRLHIQCYHVGIVQQSIIQSINISTYALYKTFIVSANVLRFLFMFVTRLIFSKFACVILVHWCVISIAYKMTHELYLRVTHKN